MEEIKQKHCLHKLAITPQVVGWTFRYAGYQSVKVFNCMCSWVCVFVVCMSVSVRTGTNIRIFGKFLVM